MNSQFELAMLGGSLTARLRRRRPGGDALPWNTLAAAVAVGAFDADSLALVRATWTNGVFTEYASAAAFAALAGAFLECGAPIDLSAAAADIVVDEIDHAELGARVVMELGGAGEFHADLALVSPATTPGARPLLRAAEIAIKTSCVGEALSVPALAHAHATIDHPLLRAVIERLLADEGPHARVGDVFLDWAADQLDADDRSHLAEVALAAIAVYRPLWADGGTAGDVLKHAVRTRIARQLARRGIALDRTRLAEIMTAS